MRSPLCARMPATLRRASLLRQLVRPRNGSARRCQRRTVVARAVVRACSRLSERVRRCSPSKCDTAELMVPLWHSGCTGLSRDDDVIVGTDANARKRVYSERGQRREASASPAKHPAVCALPFCAQNAIDQISTASQRHDEHQQGGGARLQSLGCSACCQSVRPVMHDRRRAHAGIGFLAAAAQHTAIAHKIDVRRNAIEQQTQRSTAAAHIGT